ncbi:MAG: hypothetical protein LBC65_01465 [Oscillospiraceae bacterium]|nr:hypothetical protein [Oscillospiraceae bacterium]
MANLAELFYRESKLLSNIEMQRNLLEALLVETDESNKTMASELLKTLKADERKIRESPQG